MQKFYQVLCCIFLAFLLIVGCISLFIGKPAVSDEQEGEVPVFPEISVRTILDGTFISDLDRYYAETFAGRAALLEGDGIVSRFFDFGDLTLEEND